MTSSKAFEKTHRIVTLDLKHVDENCYRRVPKDVTKLIRDAKEFAATLESLPADVLWRSARRTFPQSVVSTMRRQERIWPAQSHKPNWYVLELILRLEREVESVSAKSLGDDRPFVLAKGLLPRYAAITKQSIDGVLRDWSNASWALRELALDMKVPLVRRRIETAPPAINDCERCWRTGHRTYKGGYLCRIHVHGSNDYFEALRLDTWRAPGQDWVNESYEMAVIRRLASTVKSGLSVHEAMDGPSLKLRLRHGDKSALFAFRHHRVELGEWWSRFPYSEKYLKPKLRRARLPMNDPEAVLRALDPIDGANPEEQALVHRALLTDQRHLLELLRTAEAWLETKTKMTSRWGGRREKRDRVVYIPRDQILSVRPAKTLKKKPAQEQP